MRLAAPPYHPVVTTDHRRTPRQRGDAGLTYEQLWSLGRRSWHTPLLSIGAAVVAATALLFLLLIGVLIVAAVAGVESAPEPDVMVSPLFDNFFMLAVIACLCPVVLVVTRLVQRRPARFLHSVAGRFRWRWFCLCAAVAGVLWAVGLSVASSILTDDDAGTTAPPLGTFLAMAAALLILVPLQAAGEEYATRGFLLQTLARYGRWPAVVGSATAFAALHGFGGWPGFTALAVGAAIWALLVIRTGGLEVSVAMHAGGNLFAFVMEARTGGLSRPDDTTAADAPLPVAAFLLALDLTYALAILGTLRLLRRWRPAWLPQHRIAAPAPTALTGRTRHGDPGDRPYRP
jgi:uncharacterized protein